MIFQVFQFCSLFGMLVDCREAQAFSRSAYSHDGVFLLVSHSDNREGGQPNSRHKAARVPRSVVRSMIVCRSCGHNSELYLSIFVFWQPLFVIN